mgnify:CR=1 FL=1
MHGTMKAARLHGFESTHGSREVVRVDDVTIPDLATGEVLPYDRLILATGSAGYVPTIPGFGAAGTFVLREAEWKGRERRIN